MEYLLWKDVARIGHRQGQDDMIKLPGYQPSRALYPAGAVTSIWPRWNQIWLPEQGEAFGCGTLSLLSQRLEQDEYLLMERMNL